MDVLREVAPAGSFAEIKQRSVSVRIFGYDCRVISLDDPEVSGPKRTQKEPKKNIGHAERLIRSGKMKSAGLAETETAKKDGRWEAAYDSPSNASIPDDFLKALRKNKKAEAFFKSLNKTNLYSIAYRLQTAKSPEIRERRMNTILKMMASGKKFH